MQKQLTSQSELPDKFYFKIGEVSHIAGIPSSVLRYWESEFKNLRPKRTKSGQRMYRKKDVEIVLKIKQLLYEEKFTIQGARQYLSSKTEKTMSQSKILNIDELRRELLVIRSILKKP